jgi:hypothetical protein
MTYVTPHLICKQVDNAVDRLRHIESLLGLLGRSPESTNLHDLRKGVAEVKSLMGPCEICRSRSTCAQLGMLSSV